MKNIDSIDCAADKDSYEQIVTGTRMPQKPILVAKLQDVKIALDQYQNKLAAGTVSPLGFTGRDLDVHYSLYDSTQRFVLDLKQELVNDYLEHTCPYCQLDQVSHIDHFLPRAVFPEFSVSLQNLLMSCDTCNSKYKGQYWGVRGQQKIFHPRFNNLQGEQYLSAVAVYDSGAIRVRFAVLTRLPISGLVRRHFVKLNLGDRYIAKANASEVPSMRKLLAREPTPARKLSRIERFVDDQIDTNQVNSWKHAYYSAIKLIVREIAAGGL
jgi:hypothetical protein